MTRDSTLPTTKVTSATWLSKPKKMNNPVGTIIGVMEVIPLFLNKQLRRTMISTPHKQARSKMQKILAFQGVPRPYSEDPACECELELLRVQSTGNFYSSTLPVPCAKRQLNSCIVHLFVCLLFIHIHVRNPYLISNRPRDIRYLMDIKPRIYISDLLVIGIALRFRFLAPIFH